MSNDNGANASATQPVIINAVLAYIKHLMLSREKAMIMESICARFDVDAIKSASEAIFKFCLPE